MTPVPGDHPRNSRWTSFVAGTGPAAAAAGPSRILHELGNPAHRLRVEHDRETLLIHLSDENGHGWTVLAVDRGSRRWAVAQDRTQQAAAVRAYEQLHGS